MVKIRVVILTAFLFGTCALPPAHSQGPPTLPSWAKEYFDKGLDAAQRQAWNEAFSNFRRALGSTPEYAPVYFNLGVVFEKVGAPLEAAACLQAYLALAPNAANAVAVRQEITGLTKARAAQIATIFQRATDAIPTLPDYDRNKAYLEIARDYARAGKIRKAIDLVKSMGRDDDNPTDRVQDLRIPDPWLHYAATVMAGHLVVSSFYTLSFHSSGFPEAAQTLLVHLEKTFPIPAPIGNRNDRIATRIDKIFKERSETMASIRNYIDKALAVSSGTPDQKPQISADGSKQIAFADALISRSWDFSNDSIRKSSFDLDFQIKSNVDPKDSSFQWASDVGGPEYATVLALGKVAAEFGAELFLFELLERGSEGVRDAVEGPAVDEAVWKSVQDAKNPERFAGYLAWFPRGKYAGLADLSRKKLMAESKLASPAPKPEMVSVDEALRLGREALKVSNHPEAMRWFRAAADRGNAVAQTQVGWMYDIGNGVEADRAEALRWYRKAADQGHAEAEYRIGEIYDNGAPGIPKDPEEALRWYRKAADKGVSLAQISVGWYYKKAQNYPEAMKWYLKASDHPYAQMAIGEFYEKGLGVKKDLAQAAHWYRLVANTKGFLMENVGLEALKRIGAVK